jgi:hypothetical protein
MEKRGPKNAAELSVIKGDFGKGRPPPPPDLNERQAAIWRDITQSEPSDFFATGALKGLLADYCRHRDAAEQVSTIIGAFQPEWLKAKEGSKRYSDLLRMRELETRAAAAMATKLRLTNQARYTPQSAGTAGRNAAPGLKPWET